MLVFHVVAWESVCVSGHTIVCVCICASAFLCVCVCICVTVFMQLFLCDCVCVRVTVCVCVHVSSVLLFPLASDIASLHHRRALRIPGISEEPNQYPAPQPQCPLNALATLPQRLQHCTIQADSTGDQTGRLVCNGDLQSKTSWCYRPHHQQWVCNVPLPPGGH